MSAMRRLLVDHAHRRAARKGDGERVTLSAVGLRRDEAIVATPAVVRRAGLSFMSVSFDGLDEQRRQRRRRPGVIWLVCRQESFTSIVRSEAAGASPPPDSKRSRSSAGIV
jgi:hypothetical protein